MNLRLRHVKNLIPDPSSPLRNNIEIIYIEPRYFSTYFTLHFKDHDALDSLYMSSLLRHRDDLLIQITDGEHIDRNGLSISLKLLFHDGASGFAAPPTMPRYVIGLI